jgi:hypothetical protein
MHFDFWNNPLVVTALRIRYRRGGLMSLLISYFLVLVTASAAVFYYRERLLGPFPRNILLGVVGFQTLISFVLGAAATSQSLRSEVNNRTLDFQRIAALSPFQIFLGKLLGEPLAAFFSIIPTIPVTVYCCLILGVEGMDLFALVLVYVNILTTTVLSAALGLMQPLEGDPHGKPRQGGNAGSVLFGLFMCFVPLLMSGSWKILSTPWAAALMGIFTPIPTYLGIYEGNPWEFKMHVFDLRIPFVLVTSLSQLAVASLIVYGMMRRLVNPLRIILSRRLAYLLLIVVDFLVAGVFYEVPPFGFPLYVRGAAFWIVHIAVSYVLTTLTTPGRETLWSWSWRFRGRTGMIRDLALGDRSVNSLEVLLFALIGVVGFTLMIALPARNQFSADLLGQFSTSAVQMTLLSCILIGMSGSLYQWIAIAFNRAGRGYFISFLLLLILPADLLGRYFHNEWLVTMTPIGHFQAWFSERPTIDMLPVSLLYLTIGVIAMYRIHWRQKAMNRIVDIKLEKMGVGSSLVAGATMP